MGLGRILYFVNSSTIVTTALFADELARTHRVVDVPSGNAFTPRH
jgi:hypothetical protein